MALGADPVETDRREKVYRVGLSLAGVSLLLWLFNSYAVSNALLSIGRLIGKLHGR